MKKNIFFFITIVALLAIGSASYARMVKKSIAEERHLKTTVGSPSSTNYTAPLIPSQIEASGLAKQRTFSPKRQAMANTSDLPSLIGLMDYSESFSGTSYRGLYSLSADSESLPTPLLTNNFDHVYNCVIKDGIYYIHWGIDFGSSTSIYVCGYDIETKQRVYSTLLAGSLALTGADITLDPITETVYGILNNVNMTGYRLATIAYNGEGAYGELEVTTIANLPDDINWDALACSPEGKLYAISSGENPCLYSIDKTTGSLTKIGDTGVATYFSGSAEIDERTGRCFWINNSKDHESSIYEVNLKTGEATLACNIAGWSDFVGLVIPPAEADEAAPAASSDLTADFPEGGLSGTISFTAPTQTYGGRPLDGELSYTLEVDNIALKSGKTYAGAPESINFTVDGVGTYVFSVYFTNKAGRGPKAVCRKYIGKGTPKSPENIVATYSDGKLRVEWDPVTESSEGGYINPEEMTYTVYRGNQKVSENQKATFYEEEMDIQGHTVIKFSVSASCQGRTSALGQSDDLIFGHIDPPYSQTFDDENSLLEFTNFSAATGYDPRKWEYKYDMIVDDYKPQVRYNITGYMDAWLITSPIKMEKGKAYRITLDAFGSAGSVERIEIMAGKGNTQMDQTVTVVPPTEIHMPDGNVRNAVPLEGFFTPDEDGLFYIGIHGISDPFQGYLWIDNLKIEEGISAAAPAAVSDLSITPAPNGVKKVTISFKAPNLDLSGRPLESLSSITILSDAKEIHEFKDPLPGEVLTFVDEPAAAGDYTYTIVPSTKAGVGQKTSASVYVGLPFPAAVEEANFVETTNMGEVKLTWTPVTSDEHGVPLDKSNITYTIRQVTEAGLSEPIAEGLTDTQYICKVVEEGEQKFVQFVVYAATERGTGEPAYSNFMPVGEAFTSFEESFPNGTITNILGTGYDTNGGSWVMLKNAGDITSSDNDNGFAAMYAAQGGSCGIFTGKISLKPFLYPAFNMNIYNWSDESVMDKNEVSVDIRVVGEENWKTLETFCPSTIGGTKEGWYPVSVSLADYKDKDIQIKVQATSLNYAYVPIDALKIISLVDHDMGIHTISAPSSVNTGSNFNVLVTVSNEGGTEAKDCYVKLYGDGKEIARKECGVLQPGEKEILSFPTVMHPLAKNRVRYQAFMIYEEDENSNNNSSQRIYVTPIPNSLPKVDDLNGSLEDNGVALRWSEPLIIGANKVIEDFDSYPNGASAIEGWTFIDMDKGVVAGIQTTSGTIEIPGVTPGESTHSFIVLDTRSLLPIDEALLAPSGDMALASIGLKKGATDDWAISPELSGSAQVVSFQALSLTDENPEKIRVLYSMGGTASEDFKEAAVFSNIPENWTSYQVALPEGAKRFAINSCAPDGAMLLIDDITYSNGSEAIKLSLAGFNIYRNGEKINESVIEEFEYMDVTPFTTSQVEYQVTVLYQGKGESDGSNICSLDLSGVEEVNAGALQIFTSQGHIHICTQDKENWITIVSTDGNVLFTGEVKGDTAIPVAPGVYVVTIEDSSYKVIVR